MTITALESIDDDVLNAFNKLIPQLSSSSPVPSKKDLETIINSGNTKLFVVKEGDTILGTLTLIFNKIPTGEKGISKIDLTSSPERVAANKLYQKLGFQKRITNVYRYFNNK